MVFLLAFFLQAPPAPPPSYVPTPAELTDLRTKAEPLKSATNPDVAVYYKAIEWALRYPEEFFTKAYLANAQNVIKHGLERMKTGVPAKGRFSRGYRSRVDGSVQPYAMLVPDSYDPKKPARLDLVLHGRGATLTEISFLAAHDSDKPIPADQDALVMEVFGRTNNAYRWAGETDIFEALAAVRKNYNVDPDRIVLRGFSMGGAGAWHVGLHHPSQWAAIEAGAGFTETIKYAKLKDVSDVQRSLLHIYDAVDYSLNAWDVPTVGYGGEIDPQLAASTNIREALKGIAGLRTLFLVGPQTAHKFHPDSKKESDAFINRNLPRKAPDRIRFVTYTPRYGDVFGIHIDALEKLYSRAEIETSGSEMKTSNVARLTIDRARSIAIDGQTLTGAKFEKIGGKWQARQSNGLWKRHGLQGPIDDAFMESFLCVGDPGKFGKEFPKYMRGDVRTKPAREVDAADIAADNLILFGDPSNNGIIARIAAKLPITWQKGDIVAGSKRFSAADHTLVLIYPNPLNPNKYVVLNSGHTFGEKDFKGTNALLYPRWGDYAVIEKKTGAVKLSGLFDEHWRLQP
jgi:hypothetical protein